MAEKCGICEVDFNIVKEGVKCSECLTVQHISCVPGDVAKKTSLRKNWKCENCKSETASTGSRSGDTILEAIAAFRKEFNTRSDETHAKLEKVQEDVNAVRNDVTVLKNQYEEVKGMCVTARTDITALSVENIKLKEEVKVLKEELADLEQHTRKNNVLITGVPLTPRENVYEILKAIAALLNINNYNRYDVSVAHRLSVRRGDTKPPSIVVNFLSRSVKADWIHARRQRRQLSAKEIFNNFPDEQVYINDHLTPQTRALFNEARAMMKNSKLAAVWTDDGRVLVKKTMAGRPFRILRTEDLRQIESSQPPQPTQNENP